MGCNNQKTINHSHADTSMKKTIQSTALLGAFLGSSIVVSAQDTEMADVMRSDGKIYVVVGVLLIILTGLLAYLILLDRKLRRLEK